MAPWTFCCQTFIYPACGHNGKIIYQSVKEIAEIRGNISPMHSAHNAPTPFQPLLNNSAFSYRAILNARHGIAVHYNRLQCIAVNNSALQCSTVKCTGVLSTSLHFSSCILSLGHSEPNGALYLYFTVLYCTNMFKYLVTSLMLTK